eukprot:NODE_989_length_1278_cov_265.758790.p1 GENE.NODE_989_length_1278_cov_265.758790~~NODE_989_length_1278_cov_265.758790.p1  ORF type:complete len:289 (-),score=23.44 NODE_989_length_1278_cov_265.758790:128-994(-)
MRVPWGVRCEMPQAVQRYDAGGPRPQQQDAICQAPAGDQWKADAWHAHALPRSHTHLPLQPTTGEVGPGHNLPQTQAHLSLLEATSRALPHDLWSSPKVHLQPLMHASATPHVQEAASRRVLGTWANDDSTASSAHVPTPPCIESAALSDRSVRAGTLDSSVSSSSAATSSCDLLSAFDAAADAPDAYPELLTLRVQSPADSARQASPSRPSMQASLNKRHPRRHRLDPVDLGAPSQVTLPATSTGAARPSCRPRCQALVYGVSWTQGVAGGDAGGAAAPSLWEHDLP